MKTVFYTSAHHPFPFFRCKLCINNTLLWLRVIYYFRIKLLRIIIWRMVTVNQKHFILCRLHFTSLSQAHYLSLITAFISPLPLLLQLGLLPVSRLPWLPVHHGVWSTWWRVQTLQRVGLPCSVLPGAVAASNPAMRAAGSSPNLPVFTSPSFLLPSPRITSWCFTIKMFTTLLFCSVAT